MPKRIQRKRSKGWRMPDGAVCVGRPSIFGNPYRIQRFSVSDSREDFWVVWVNDAQFVKVPSKDKAVELSVRLFRTSIDAPQNTRLVEMAKLELRGKDLACWCSLDQPCHADVLLEIANQ